MRSTKGWQGSKRPLDRLTAAFFAAWTLFPVASAAGDAQDVRRLAAEAAPLRVAFPDTESVSQWPSLTVPAHPPAFAPDGRVYLRTALGVDYQSVEGDWQEVDFRQCLSSNPRVAASYKPTAIHQQDLRIVFDNTGRAYTLVSAEVLGTARQYLLTKAADDEEWTAVPMASGQIRLGWTGRPDPLERAPSLLVLPWADGAFLQFYHGDWIGGRYRIRGTVPFAAETWPIMAMGSDANCLVPVGTLDYAFFANQRGVPGSSGTPQSWWAWDHGLLAGSRVRLLGLSESPMSDDHDRPAAVVDSQDRLHVVFGAHNRPFRYTQTRDSARVYRHVNAWSDPTIIGPSFDPDAGRNQTAWLMTYPSLVIDHEDTLHLAARRFFPGGGMHLVYLRKTANGEWEEPRSLVAPEHLGYSNFYHRLSVAPDGRVFLTFYLYVNQFVDEEARIYQETFSRERLTKTDMDQGWGRFFYNGVQPHGPHLLVSHDRGNTWKLAEAADVERPLGPVVDPPPSFKQ